ncbi:MAG TPA: phosphoribosyltransferase family protein [Micromonosporaceae bacterium]|nr:phosphoribosyltransferase family protein [Micromonosporaceae bacterium]
MHADVAQRLAALFRWVDPGPGSDHLVSDCSGWWRDPATLAALGPALADLFQGERPTVVVAPELTGVLLGPLVAVRLGAGFVPAVKGDDGRVPAEPTTWVRAGRDYRGRSVTLGVRDRHLNPGDRVLVVDDWVATGAQVRALYELIAARGAEPVGTAAIVVDCLPAVAEELRIRSLLTGDDLSSS